MDDAGQAGAVIDTRSAAVTPWWQGQQGLNGLPQPLGERVSMVVVMATDSCRRAV
jgi:hypothetical protein